MKAPYRLIRWRMVSLIVGLLFSSWAQADTYSAGAPITDVSITNPTSNEVWLIQTPHNLICTTSMDYDCNETTRYQEADSVTHYWTQTGGAVFQNNDNIGQFTTIYCPATAGNVTVTVHADDDYAPASNSALYNEAEKTDQETFSVVGLWVVEFGFRYSSHTIYETPTTLGGWGDGTAAYDHVIYSTIDTPHRNDPAVITCGAHFAEVFDLHTKTLTALTESSGYMLSAGGTNNWEEDSCGTYSGETISVAYATDIDGSMVDYVKVYDNSYTFNWKYRCLSGLNFLSNLNTTTHTVYLTWGAPDPGGAEATEQRIDFLCTNAAYANTEYSVAAGIQGALGGSPPIDGYQGEDWSASNDWELMSGQPYCGDCIAQAQFMVRCLKLIGSDGFAYYTYASSDTNQSTYESKVQDGYTWFLKFDRNNDGEIDNRFEGSVCSADHYFSVWPAYQSDTALGLLLELEEDGWVQRWGRTLHNDFNENTINHLPGTVPFPDLW